jgi:hypothetical protein
MLHIFLYLSAVSLFVHLQINISRSGTSYSATASQSFRFSVKILGRSALAQEGGRQFFFFFVRSALSAALYGHRHEILNYS